MNITQDMINCWKANYALDKHSPEDAARYWADRCAGMAPAGAVAALGLLLIEREALRKIASEAEKISDAWRIECEALRKDAEQYRWLRDKADGEICFDHTAGQDEGSHFLLRVPFDGRPIRNDDERAAVLGKSIDAAIRAGSAGSAGGES